MKRPFSMPALGNARSGLAGLLGGCVLALAGCGGGGDGAAPVDGGGGGAAPPALPTGSVSLLAGSIGGAGNLDGSGAAARFDGPSGLALGPDGDLYVADLRNQRIRRVTRAGAVGTFAGSGESGNADGPARSATFCFPRDVAVDPVGGNVFVATDTTVRRITPDAVVTTVAGAGAARCGVYDGSIDLRVPPASPTAVAADAFGVIYIGDSYAGAVYTLTPGGVLTRLAGGEGRGNPQPLYPTGIALDAARNVYVADAVGGGLLRITQSGQPTALVPAGTPALGYPQGVAADATGNVYVADFSRNVVRRVTPSGSISVIAGVEGEAGSIDGPRGRARLDQPQGLALTADGTTLFVSEGANTIRSIDLASGSVRTLAGLATPRLQNLGAYQAVDRAGNVYFAEQVAGYPDATDYAIRRIAPDGTVTTLLGGGLGIPRGMVLDGAGNLYVVEVLDTQCFRCTVNTVVRKVTPQGGLSLLAGTLAPVNILDADGIGSAAALRGANGLSIDAAGNLYVSQDNRKVRKITTDGAVSTLAANLPGSPSDIAVDAAGSTLYLGMCPAVLGQSYGATLLKVDLRSGGNVTPLAGSPTETGYRDGAGAQARFGGCLSGIALDAAGNVFVADSGNAVVRKVASDGTVSTVAGRAGMRGITLGRLPATLSAPTDVSVDGAGNLYVGSAHALLKVRFDDNR